jgi:aminopeptidase N
MKHPTCFLVLCLVLAASSRLDGEEQICRYCAEHLARAMPLGMDLEGRYHYAPDRQVDVLHIKLDVTPDFERRTVAGTASITVTPISGSVEFLRLDAVDLSIDAVRCDEVGIADFVSTREDLQIAFATPVAPGKQITVHVDYSAQPTAGLYFRTPQQGYPASDTHIWTQGETHEARHWFPCFDYPNERSSTEVICHVPAGMTVLSNGRRLGESTDKNGLTAVHWLHEKPHVSYLICLVAGNLTKLTKQHRDVPLGFYTQPTLAEHAANSFRDTPSIMAFYEQEIGVPFPWPKYDQVTIRDFLFGGMENTTLTTLTSGTIFSRETENIHTTRRLDAHEMAHQWFGDYVTCKDWSHLWLNEGFATYYTHLYEGHAFGQDALLYGLYRDATNRVLTQKDDKKPVVYRGYKNAMEQFDYRSYPKGSWVLHMLRCQLGPDLYRRCVKAYLEEHALGSVVSDDFRKVLEQHSGRTLDRFFDQWLYHPRHPDLKISYAWLLKQRLAKVTIEQTQRVDDDVLLYHFPTKLRFIVDGKPVDREIQVTKAREDFYVALDRQPSIVRFDPEYTVLADVSFDKPNDLLKAQIANTDDMMGRLLACKSLGERKTHQSVGLLETALNTDPFYGVRITAAEALAKHESKEADQVLRNSWRGQTDARVRLAVVEHVTKRFTEDTLESILEVLAEERNPAILAVAIKALGRFHGEPSRTRIIGYLRSESFRNELAVAAISAIRQQNDASYQAVLMEVLREHEDRFTSRGFGQGLEALAHVTSALDAKDQVRAFLVRYVNHPKVPVRVAAIDALGTLGDPRAIAVLEAFSDSSDGRIARAAQRSISELREKKPPVPQELVELRKDLAAIKKDREKLQAQLEEIRRQLEARE